ncbi:substrate-binding domain-containing protein [Paenibacillus apiarius]|uniref:substrate-binding domain-containing protein n=1 Tax=Paenibacillus apiarius TaxID=46240 RepID=UPI003B3A3800
MKKGARAVLDLYQRDPAVTAICCANDLMALGAIMALSQQGVRVPEDISIVGYDVAFFTAYTNPPLRQFGTPTSGSAFGPLRCWSSC